MQIQEVLLTGRLCDNIKYIAMTLLWKQLLLLGTDRPVEIDRQIGKHIYFVNTVLWITQGNTLNSDYQQLQFLLAGDESVRFMQSSVHGNETISALNTNPHIKEGINTLISGINYFSQGIKRTFPFLISAHALGTSIFQGNFFNF